MFELDVEELRSWAGFGVAGNFAGHLEQAGEAVDFVNVASEGVAPKGIFPWYLPGHPGLLGEFPLSNTELRMPEPNADGSPVNLQIEPEVALAARVIWDGDTVAELEPFALGAFNDCSIRRPGAPKISDKKNWGPASKGVARYFFEVSDLSPAGPTSRLRLECLLIGDDGQPHAYGVNSGLQEYSYFGDRLLDWIVDRLANQKGSPETPLEDVGALLVAAGRPEKVLIGIGATRYTELGASTFLKPGDTAMVRVYSEQESATSTLKQAVR
ncbi:DUF5718 family protein [Mycolicibacterium brumae]|uniref:Fumarylacetoacetate hydrolase n=1 Tax=Mycolicibacterium brumae TaxID=85968 RepID=A0A2G5PDJ4_9MYCO|nr:DUF5718 family protein [Mycolicibacterium brumae]MCV7191782.1 hypothetical protein [Mycolicibacterium brumae]PIB76386.1 hypothetical protein CQY22_006360 [Mycolicibacterium brumae]UWW07088.1 DUF5718 family protein [Mycolicibacterium brumae]